MIFIIIIIKTKFRSWNGFSHQVHAACFFHISKAYSLHFHTLLHGVKMPFHYNHPQISPVS